MSALPASTIPAPREKSAGISNLFGTAAYALTTLAIIAVAVMAIPQLMAWAVTNAIWRGDGDACRDAGACWAFLHAKLPFILFGIYPDAERWRPMLVVALFILLTLWTMPPRHWTRRTLAAWGVAMTAALALMAGGMGGLSPVPTSDWGGLPVTILLTVFTLAFGFPLGVLLALGRRSRLPAIRWASILFIETFRALPLLTLLFVAALLAPLLLPEGFTADNLLRALMAFTLSSAAYIAEVLRGGLQGVARGQEEAAQALGLRWHQSMTLVVLPQAIRIVLPPLTSTIVVIIKNTSLVLVVGLFDLLSAGRVALGDPAWPNPYAETYLLIALVYFGICYAFARYAVRLERLLKESGR